MSRARFALPILLGVILALWGCTSPSTNSSNAEARSLETRVAKLEKDLKSTQEQLKSSQDQLKSSQDQLKFEQAKLLDAVRERDDARLQAKAKSGELAKSQADLESFRKGLKDLLGKVDAALAPASGGSEASALALPQLR